ncbi:MAG: hypothetical protein ACRD3P_05740 [Terriglobales bacterium]
MCTRFVSLLFALFAALVPAAISQTSVSVTYNYAPLKFPNAPVTNVNGINNSNVIVGSYYDSQYFVHGFIYRAGKYTAVNFPGATMTEVLGINDYSDIVGTYQMPGALNFHGFLRHNGVFTKINDPSAKIGTMATGINKAGTIVGTFDNEQGFVYQNGAYRTLNAPQLAGESHETQLSGINNLGAIVGQVFTGGIWRGFWISNNHIHYVEAAGSVDSQANGINGHGDIAGCHDVQSGFLSFLATSAAKYPAQQAIVSCAAGINYARVAVGTYSTLSKSYGFLAVPALTLQVSRAMQSSAHGSVVHVTAAATGINPVAHMQVWLNGTEVYHVPGQTLNANVTLPAASSDRLVVQAIDSKGKIAKVVNTIAVN